MKLKILTIPFLFFSIQVCAACASLGERAIASSDSPQFYLGQIQRMSLSGQPYGPSFESLVRRIVDKENGKIFECVFQEGKVFVTEMSRTDKPLQYAVKDFGGYSSGFLNLEDESASAWSYNVDVLKPYNGKITGSLADGKGARIYPDGRMEITKVWNNQMLIVEKYHSISGQEYQTKIESILLTDEVKKLCK